MPKGSAKKNLTEPSQSHYEACYLIEGFKWMRQKPKIRTLARKKSLNIRQKGISYKLAIALESAYDDTIPLTARMKKMDVIFKEIKHLRNVDKELLLWLGLARWLDRQGIGSLSEMALNEYISLSLRLTSGKIKDGLGIGSDLITKYQS